MESALYTLIRMIPIRGKQRAIALPQFHEESIIPRVTHVLSAMHAGTFKGSTAIAVAACHILFRLIHDDGMLESLRTATASAACLQSVAVRLLVCASDFVLLFQAPNASNESLW
jgi:hypothetical protein